MATKPKAGAPKKGAANKTDKEIQKTQSARFIETAREIGADETGKTFEKTFNAARLKRNSN